MQRIPAVTQPSGKAAELLGDVKKALGATPNIFTTLANSPAALSGYLAFNGALAGGALGKKLSEQIAMAIAGFNGCNYCASAHTFIGEKLGVSKAELAANGRGQAEDPRTQAAINFALALLEKRGRASDEDLAAVREAGFSDEEIIEILAHVALNVLTNYFNETVQTSIDFPKVDLGGH